MQLQKWRKVMYYKSRQNTKVYVLVLNLPYFYHLCEIKWNKNEDRTIMYKYSNISSVAGINKKREKIALLVPMKTDSLEATSQLLLNKYN
jgi:hypothetical protein